jgi:hypothetical protein
LERWAKRGGYGLILIILKPNALQCDVVTSSTAADLLLEQGGGILDTTQPISVRMRPPSLNEPPNAIVQQLTLSQLFQKKTEWTQLAKLICNALDVEFKIQVQQEWFPSAHFRQQTAPGAPPLFISQASVKACSEYISAALPILSQGQFSGLTDKVTPQVFEVLAFADRGYLFLHRTWEDHGRCLLSGVQTHAFGDPIRTGQYHHEHKCSLTH